MAEKSQESTPPDPSATLRDFVAQWEKGINALANATMATDEFAGATNATMSVALRAQQMMGAAMSTYLATMNLPSRADVTAIAERLQSVEAYLARIAVALEGSAPPAVRDAAAPKRRAPRPKRPPRTKRPPGSGPA